MRLEYDRPVGAGGPTGGVEAVVDLEIGWIARLQLEAAGSSVEVREVRFERTTDDDPAGVALLRRLRLKSVLDELDVALSDPWLAAQLGPTWGSMSRRRPGRRGRNDLYYALVARDYVEALAVDARAPIKLLRKQRSARGEDVTEEQLRAQLGTARRLGLLTKAEAGTAGGRLTAKAKKLLASPAKEV